MSAKKQWLKTAVVCVLQQNGRVVTAVTHSICFHCQSQVLVSVLLLYIDTNLDSSLHDELSKSRNSRRSMLKHLSFGFSKEKFRLTSFGSNGKRQTRQEARKTFEDRI